MVVSSPWRSADWPPGRPPRSRPGADSCWPGSSGPSRRRRRCSCGRGAATGRGVRGRRPRSGATSPIAPPGETSSSASRSGSGPPTRCSCAARARSTTSCCTSWPRTRSQRRARDGRTSPTPPISWWTSTCPRAPASRRSSRARPGRARATRPPQGPTTGRSTSPSCTTPRTPTGTRPVRSRGCWWRSMTTTASREAISTSPTTSSSMRGGGSGRLGPAAWTSRSSAPTPVATTRSRPESPSSGRSRSPSLRPPRWPRFSNCWPGSSRCTGSRRWARSASRSTRLTPSTRRSRPASVSCSLASPVTATGT